MLEYRHIRRYNCNMSRKKSTKKGKIITVLGVLLIAAALGLSAYNVWIAQKAGETSSAVLDSIDLSETLAPPWYTDREMPVLTKDGVDYIGVLTIPDLNLQLPVAADWSYDQLINSPCRYNGNYFMNDMVVCAHNYTTHFGKLISCDLGIDVYFQNVEGYVFKYVISDRKTVQPNGVLEMIINRNNFEQYLESDLSSSEGADGTISREGIESISLEESEEWDLTLYTCNWGGRSRCTIRCTRIRE